MPPDRKLTVRSRKTSRYITFFTVEINFVLLFFSNRILFKDKDRNWDEIESKLHVDSDAPLLKTSNKVKKLHLPESQ